MLPVGEHFNPPPPVFRQPVPQAGAQLVASAGPEQAATQVSWAFLGHERTKGSPNTEYHHVGAPKSLQLVQAAVCAGFKRLQLPALMSGEVHTVQAANPQVRATTLYKALMDLCLHHALQKPCSAALIGAAEAARCTIKHRMPPLTHY